MLLSRLHGKLRASLLLLNKRLLLSLFCRALLLHDQSLSLRVDLPLGLRLCRCKS